MRVKISPGVDYHAPIKLYQSSRTISSLLINMVSNDVDP